MICVYLSYQVIDWLNIHRFFVCSGIFRPTEKLLKNQALFIRLTNMMNNPRMNYSKLLGVLINVYNLYFMINLNMYLWIYAR